MQPSVHLEPGQYVESRDADVVAFAKRAAAGASDTIDLAIRLYRAVRDEVIYDPYQEYCELDTYSGAAALARGRGYCVAKAALLAACARASGIPARLGFADVRNHLATPRLTEMNGGDVFRWHAYADLWLDERWVKATPAFNLALCERFDVLPLEFDGRTDSVFHPFDKLNRRHMEYVKDRGTYADVPVVEIMATFRETCPKMMRKGWFETGDFAAEAQS